jgi:Phosphate-selective porin O and P
MDNYIRRTANCCMAALAIGFLSAQPARAQVVIKVNDDVNFKLGVLGQFQADTIDNPEPAPNTSNLFVRRLRLMFGGQVAKNVSFFVETDAPNLGKTLPAGKNIQPSVILQDAFAELRVADAFTLDAGLMFVPFSRNSLQSAATLLPIDYGTNTFNDSAPTESATGRDTGFQARGYFANNRLEYRIGAFQGFRDAGSDNAFRYAGRVQYNVLDAETGFFYTGTYLGKKKVLAVGAAFDAQKDFHAYDVDAFFDYPMGPGAVTAQFDYNHFDGGTTLTTLAKQNDILLEAGYLLKALKITPVLQYSQRNFSDLSTGDEKRTAVGASYWWTGQNVNIKALYTRIAPRGLDSQNELTVQFQIFYF